MSGAYAFEPVAWWPKPPTVDELIKRFGLTDQELRRVAENHDSGDEDRSARNYCRIVCSLAPGRECGQRPNHWGPHDHGKEKR